MKFFVRKLSLFISVLALSATLCGTVACAEVNISDTDLMGDTAFINKVINLAGENIKNTIYVSLSGNDSNDGSEQRPYKTINAALDNAKAGTTVYVREGTYTENITFSASGNANAYITLKNYPNEKPVLKGTGKTDKAIIELNGHDYIHIEGLELCDYTAMWCYGILFSGGENHIIINDNTIHDIKCSKPNDPDNSGANAVLLFGETKEPISNVYIGNNNIYNLVTGWSEVVSVTANCEYINIVNNTISSSTNIGIDFYGNNADGYCDIEELNQPRYCLASGNTVSGCVCDYSTCYGIYVDGARDITIENNITYDNQGGIEIGSEERNECYPVKNIIVRNNLVYNNSDNGITVGGWNDGSSKTDAVSGIVYNTKIYNNTVVNNGKFDFGQLHIAMVDGVDIRNNIFYTDKSAPLVTSDVATDKTKNLTFKSNLYYSAKADENNVNFELMNDTQSGMKQWTALTGETGSFANPCFGDSYTLTTASPAINSGDGTIDSGKYDIASNDRAVGNIDIGAYEYAQATQTTADNTADICVRLLAKVLKNIL